MRANFVKDDTSITFHVNENGELIIAIDTIEADGIDFAESRVIALNEQDIRQLMTFIKDRI